MPYANWEAATAVHALGVKHTHDLLDLGDALDVDVDLYAIERDGDETTREDAMAAVVHPLGAIPRTPSDVVVDEDALSEMYPPEDEREMPRHETANAVHALGGGHAPMERFRAHDSAFDEDDFD